MTFTTFYKSQTTRLGHFVKSLSLWDWFFVSLGGIIWLSWVYFNPLLCLGVTLLFAIFYPFLGFPDEGEKMTKTLHFKGNLGTYHWKFSFHFWYLIPLLLFLVILLEPSLVHAQTTPPTSGGGLSNFIFLQYAKEKVAEAACIAIGESGTSCQPGQTISNNVTIVQIIILFGVLAGLAYVSFQAAQQSDPTPVVKYVVIIVALWILGEQASRMFVG